MSFTPILQQTQNLLRLYMHQTGKTETPDEYHAWSCIALVAAAVGDHVWYSHFKHVKLYPNLYTLLVGPSGSGKDVAFSLALSFVSKLPVVKLYAEHLAMREELHCNVIARQRHQVVGQKGRIKF